VSERVLRLAGEGGGHGQLDAAAGEPDERADLQESEPDRATGGFGELRVSKAEKMRAKTRPKRASGVQVRFGCRGRHIRAGDWISAGATTGVHRADPGASVVVTYGNLGTIVLRLIRVEA
jgi:hypothetical protein